MNPWWWVPIGLVAWFLIATVAALLIGPVLKRSARIRDSIGPEQKETNPEPEKAPDKRKSSQDERQAS